MTGKGRLILIDGMCGAGKSTAAQKLSRQFESLSLPHRWMHEEIDGHPIREGEFEAGDLTTLDGMALNIEDMNKRWQHLVDTVNHFGGTYILEGCFIHAIDRYFYKSAYSAQQTLDYFDRVSNVLAQSDTLFVYLRTPDARATLANVFPIRGQWWKDLILSPEERFFDITEHKGEETAYACCDLFHAISDEVFDRYPGDKLLIHASNGSWPGYPRKIMRHLGLPYVDIPRVSLEAPESYCGVYSAVINGAEEKIEVKYDPMNDTLYTVGFWPYMKLVPITANTFEYESFPTTLHFSAADGRRTITGTGEYGMNVEGNTYTMI